MKSLLRNLNFGQSTVCMVSLPFPLTELSILTEYISLRRDRVVDISKQIAKGNGVKPKATLRQMHPLEQ